MPQQQDRRQIVPRFSKNKVNKAAERISLALNKGQEIDINDEEIVENWRASHAHILNTWQVILRKKIGNRKIFFAQRHKRKNTIYNKLKRYPNMPLARMHDIAGCRLIFRNENDMISYINGLHLNKNFHHERKEGQYKNYIAEPKESGYRGIHDVYAYKSRHGKDRSDKWNGLLIEIQYRTIYQHAWATAVEVAGFLTGDKTKFDEGSDDQKEFFRYASEIIARVYENKKSCKATLSNDELIEGFKELEKKTHLLKRLSQLKMVVRHAPKFTNNMILRFFENNKKLALYSFNNASDATNQYFLFEKKFPEDDVVLVKAQDRKNMENSFKNYFGDTKDFVGYIEDGIKRLSNQPHSN